MLGKNGREAVGDKFYCSITYYNYFRDIPPEGQEYDKDVSWCSIRSLEHVVLNIDATYCVRGFLKVEVESPDRTRSVVLPGRINDRRSRDIVWSAMSVHFWDERSEGRWTIKLSNMNYHEASDCRGINYNNTKYHNRFSVSLDILQAYH